MTKRKTLAFEDAYTAEELDEQYHDVQDRLERVDADYVEHVQRTARLNEADKPRRVNALTQFYHMQLMYSCVAPFAEGINADTITRAGGMFLGAYLCSKQFRAQVKEYGAQHDRRKAEKQLAKLDDWQARTGKELSPSKQRRRDSLIRQINGGRMPLSPKSTALTHIGFAKRAYEDMRKPDADMKQIMEDYDSAVESLYRQAQADGCDLQDVSRNFRMSVAMLASKDPSVNAMFTETCYGGYRPKVEQEYETTMTKDGPVTTEYATFNGAYMTPTGKPYTGTFHLRPPRSVDDHVNASVDMIASDLTDAGGNGARFADALSRHYDDDRMAARRQAFKDDFPNGAEAKFEEAKAKIEKDMFGHLASVFDVHNPERDGREPYPWESEAFNQAFLERLRRNNPDLADRIYGPDARAKDGEAPKKPKDNPPPRPPRRRYRLELSDQDAPEEPSPDDTGLDLN